MSPHLNLLPMNLAFEPTLWKPAEQQAARPRLKRSLVSAVAIPDAAPGAGETLCLWIRSIHHVKASVPFALPSVTLLYVLSANMLPPLVMTIRTQPYSQLFRDQKPPRFASG